MPALTINVTSQQTALTVDKRRLAQAVRRVLREAGLLRAVVSVAVVDDAAIRRLNARYLGHDFATDALTFTLDSSDDFVEGEIIVSAETAVAAAPGFASTSDDELLLYVIHGALHLVGYRDDTETGRAEMREKERYHLSLSRSERAVRRPLGHVAKRDVAHRRCREISAARGRGSRRKQRTDA